MGEENQQEVWQIDADKYNDFYSNLSYIKNHQLNLRDRIARNKAMKLAKKLVPKLLWKEWSNAKLYGKIPNFFEKHPFLNELDYNNFTLAIGLTDKLRYYKPGHIEAKPHQGAAYDIWKVQGGCKPHSYKETHYLPTYYTNPKWVHSERGNIGGDFRKYTPVTNSTVDGEGGRGEQLIIPEENLYYEYKTELPYTPGIEGSTEFSLKLLDDLSFNNVWTYYKEHPELLLDGNFSWRNKLYAYKIDTTLSPTKSISNRTKSFTKNTFNPYSTQNNPTIAQGSSYMIPATSGQQINYRRSYKINNNGEKIYGDWELYKLGGVINYSNLF